VPTYQQNKTTRLCAICGKPIVEFAYMIDLFRSQGQTVEWVDLDCVRKAIETFLLKKRAREKNDVSKTSH
jgi:hypothetical protein